MAEPDEDNTIYWYEPTFRGIIPLETFKVSKNLQKLYNKKKFDLRINFDFEAVMRACASRDETWISEELIEIYCALNKIGNAFSFEAWLDGKLAGGLYGVSMGRAFFGESMFHNVTDASKIALMFLVETLKKENYQLLDCQFITEHLKQFGAVEIPQSDYLILLHEALL